MASCFHGTLISTALLARFRFYRELALQQSYPLLDDGWPFAVRIQLRLRLVAFKWKTAAIVFNFHLQCGCATLTARAPVSLCCVAHVHQRFLHNSRNFPAYWLRHFHCLHIRAEPRRDPCLPLEPLDRIA